MRESETPVISVIVPALNEEQLLPECLRSLKNQQFDRPYEIIVVDNGSDDGTAEAAAREGVRVVVEPHHGVTWARQKGLETAAGSILAFVDADTTVADDWLAQIFDSLMKNPTWAAVSGRIRYTESDNWRGKLPNVMVFFSLYSDMAFRWLFRKPGTLWGANFGVRKEALVKAGGFNKNIKFFGDDTELSLRLGKVGKIGFNKNQWAFTSPRRFENQGILKTSWAYIFSFISLVAFNKDFYGGAQKPRRRVFGIPLRKAAYALSILALPAALVFFAYNPASQFYGKVYSAGFHRNEKEVALTFDDGPNEPYTSEVLKILEVHKIRATFFLIGANAEHYPATVENIVRQGHVLGNHSYSHAYFLPFESRQAIQNDVTRAESVLFDLTSLKTALFRPPHGLRTPWMLKDVRDLNYRIVTWSAMTDDYDADEPPQKIAAQILKNVRPGTIIDLHDGKALNHGIDRSNTLRALPIILAELEKRGYRFVTVPELLHVNAYKP